MRIPIFVSCPTALNRKQESARNIILSELKRMQLEPRALGRSDYPTESPLREVYVIAKHCSGGIILGFEQSFAKSVLVKRGIPRKQGTMRNVSMPTSWNHLEAGILFGMNLPLLVFKEDGISGGVFDEGVTDNYIHKMPTKHLDATQKRGLADVFLKWQYRVRNHYYG
jgi:hypothetical protein